jgi:hypothetical protein
LNGAAGGFWKPNAAENGFYTVSGLLDMAVACVVPVGLKFF